MRNLQNKFKMNRIFTFIAAVVLGTMISCSPAQKESKPVQVQQQNQVPQTMLKADTSATISSVPATVPVTAKTNQPAAVNASTTPPEMNPPHGQPFHRCDIPVGSPLKSAAPAKPASVQNAPQIRRTGMAPTLENAARLNNPQANNTNSPTVANATKPKLNPPHGQPFHRCDIAVGSPLP
jgi:hypothetical protein